RNHSKGFSGRFYTLWAVLCRSPLWHDWSSRMQKVVNTNEVGVVMCDAITQLSLAQFLPGKAQDQDGTLPTKYPSPLPLFYRCCQP
ncbi:hypothetical protein, partial [Pseudomonas aeruginosa]|uniref:hypothetical protein n=1 Tax=Pseudomonas aeruginosa TaxID=287 RepID=UPI001BA9D77F